MGGDKLTHPPTNTPSTNGVIKTFSSSVPVAHQESNCFIIRPLLVERTHSLSLWVVIITAAAKEWMVGGWFTCGRHSFE